MRKIRADLTSALFLLGRKEAELSLLFVGSRRMKLLNQRYRGIPKETDVLSFPMDEGFSPGDITTPMLGDIVISVPRAISQARQYESTFEEELRRLLIHGLLHLLGYDHEKSRYLKAKMEKKEKEIRDAFVRLD
ncbi:MAG: rRNA maturation RNase YbeY [Nitrospirae bacterium]|nr:rRNA maturation RNase YbeY [Nitrospirota bacterium]